jgi:lipoyl(octanoyl) transferase
LFLRIYTLHGRTEGLCPLDTALIEQGKLLDQKKNKDFPDTDDYIFFAEHPHVYTCTANDASNLPRVVRSIKDDGSPNLPAPLVEVSRTAGSITYHGPGQIVCYMIIDAKNLPFPNYTLGLVLDVIIVETLRQYGISAQPKPKDYPKAASGVWALDEGVYKKIASRGISMRGGITTFGFALNVNTDLSFFDPIFTCSLENLRMTSMLDVTEVTHSLSDIICILEQMIIENFQKK